MRRVVFLLSMAIFVAALVTNGFAAGGKVRGEKGKGAVNQIQVKDPPPFGED